MHSALRRWPSHARSSALHACDDNNVVEGDGCSKDCAIEAGYNCGSGDEKSVDVCGLIPSPPSQPPKLPPPSPEPPKPPEPFATVLRYSPGMKPRVSGDPHIRLALDKPTREHGLILGYDCERRL